MAEVVHRNLESMLPQLEELEASGIFSHNEIKQIVRRRRNHEYKLLRRPARKEDFLAAVQYEMHLEQLRQHRKKRLGVATSKQDAENGIQNRIHSLFSRALRKFKGDLKLWLQHIDFSKECGHKVTLSRTFGRALAIHANNPGLWVMAAKFEFEDMKSISSARALLQQGLRANPQSRHLWTEYFRMELLHTDKVKKRRAVLGVDMVESEEPSTDQFLANRAASLVYRQAVSSIPDDVEFRLSFLPIYRLFPDTTSLQDEVFRDVEAVFPIHPLVWQAKATRHWEGLDKPLTGGKVEELEAETEAVFKEGIAKAADDRGLVEQHWDRYIQWCRERVEDGAAVSRLEKKAVHRMLAAFKQSSQSGHLSQTKFQEYIDTMISLDLTSEARSISKQATIAHPTSAGLWLTRLSCEGGDVGSEAGVTCEGSGKGDVERMGELCREALGRVAKEEASPIWEFWIKYTLVRETNPDDTESLFKHAIGCGTRAVAEWAGGCYLEWAYDVGGAKKARRAYKSLLTEAQSVSHSLYDHCIKLEQRVVADGASGGSLKHLRELYQNALRDHGTDSIDLWLGWIRAELNFPGGQVERVGKLYWKAIKELKPELTADFVSRYSLMSSKPTLSLTSISC